MNADLTPEQKAADLALESALDQVGSAYGWDGVRVAWLMVAQSVVIGPDGDQRTSIQYQSPDGQSWVTTLGLVRAHTLCVERDYLHSHVDDD